ncbi:solute carrier family 23 member 2-like [Haliotis rufescens]|uniref:solute carrier family 23 member 2-like n=1 Tax=Haliotis rufescens TaxID=6454 RepID=UPI00201F26B1|nr:solute carrier family 23 member 2-like [Haliotis rufescens]
MMVEGHPSQDGDSRTKKESVIYGVEDTPSIPLWFVFGLQQTVMCITGTLSIPFLITRQICASQLTDVTAKLLSVSFFMCGVSTLLQDTIGIRLPIIQGGSHTFIPPIVAMMSLKKWECPPDDIAAGNETIEAAWLPRIREIQGNLILASLTQVVLGCTGLIGFLLRFIGPLTIAPTISLIGLSLTVVVNDFSKSHWGVAFLSMCLILMFSLFLGRFKPPVPSFSRAKGCHVSRYPLFQPAPVLLAIGISWLFCHVLTITDVFPNNATLPGYLARTDAASRLQAVDNAPWFYFPYPFQFGMPTFSAAGYVGLLAATISSVIESIGDYFAAARVSDAPPPPPHAINRGIAMEGFGSIISGMVGSGHATTSYSGNVGAIAITKVASRRVFQTAGLLLVLCGLVGKFGAVITLIPEPIIGGLNAVLLGMVAAVGISTLQFTDLSSSRNLTILGLSLMLGLGIPQWIYANPDAINTGNTELDQVINVLLGTAMFVGGFIGCFLDNIVPGTLEERGLTKWRQKLVGTSDGPSHVDQMKLYDFPFVMKYLRRIACCAYIPFMPTFDKDICKAKTNDDDHENIEKQSNHEPVETKDAECRL